VQSITVSAAVALSLFACSNEASEPPAALATPVPGVVADAVAIPAASLLTPMVEIAAGEYFPLYSGKGNAESVPVDAFQLEVHPVTHAQFLEFVQANPKWQRSRVPQLFAEQGYLAKWPSDLEIPAGQDRAPVTDVSWFAARAYAEWVGRRLPTLAEWEYVGAASTSEIRGSDDPEFNQRILNWYAKPTPAALPEVMTSFVNVHGVHDMHGLIWEWVDDYNSALVSGESRGDSGLERNLFCGSGSIGSVDPSDYAAFMRYAFRSSLEARYSVGNLGFRCAQDLPATVQ